MTAPNVSTATAIWELDPTHSSVEFSVKHMMMTTVRGRFKTMKATLTADEEHPEGCCVEVEIDVASIDTGSADRDAHLRSADFFDAEQYPRITFTSKRLQGDFAKEGDRFRMVGDLTIRDTVMEVTLDCEFAGRGQDPWGKERAGFTAQGEIDRREWGLKWNQVIETGGVLVANKVRIEAEVQFVKQG
ncbi:MAG TPA: YceI family protein [Gemmatimonadales bacterium]|nr:YceI family protein [Gemmatimonadales bacterium]